VIEPQSVCNRRSARVVSSTQTRRSTKGGDGAMSQQPPDRPPEGWGPPPEGPPVPPQGWGPAPGEPTQLQPQQQYPGQQARPGWGLPPNPPKPPTSSRRKQWYKQLVPRLLMALAFIVGAAIGGLNTPPERVSGRWSLPAPPAAHGPVSTLTGTATLSLGVGAAGSPHPDRGRRAGTRETRHHPQVAPAPRRGRRAYPQS
jgi:hypothetical protein